MEVQKCDELNRQLMIGSKYYSLQHIKWTSTNFNKYDNIGPQPRYLHSILAFQGKIYVYGGASLTHPILQSYIHIFDLATQEWLQSSNKSCIQSLDSHSSAVMSKQMYFFGGSIQKMHLRDSLLKYDPKEDIWEEVLCEGTVPKPRQLSIFLSIDEQYLFMYGGIDMLQGKIYTDAFILHNKVWYELNTTNKPSERIKMGAAVCGNRIFIHGGQIPSQNHPLFASDLYELIINDINHQVVFKIIRPITPQIPVKRSSHGMVGLSERYFVIIGGETLNQNKNENKLQILYDLWLFDVQEFIWIQLHVENEKLPKCSQFPICMDGNKIYIFGGFNDFSSITNDLITISFKQIQNNQRDSCTNCLQKIQNHKTKKQIYSEQTSVSIGFIAKLAMEIKFPFHAITLIIQCVELMKANNLKIYSDKTKENLLYYIFYFDGKAFNHSQFIAIAKQIESTDKINKFSFNLKMGSFRLGRTFLFITSDSQYRRVLLMSSDSSWIPDVQQKYLCFQYSQDFKKNKIQEQQGYRNKNIIVNLLKSFVDDPFEILACRSSNRIYIFNVNIMTTAEHNYFYELFLTETQIRVCTNDKKVNFLENIGYQLLNHSQFSLHHYLSIWKQLPQLSIVINNNLKPIAFLDYQKILDNYQKLGYIKPIQLNPLKDVIHMNIYKCNRILSDNNGILLYCCGKLINRFQNEFGTMFMSKFYKKKYKKIENIWNHVGIVCFSDSCELNFAKDGFKKTIQYKKVIAKIMQYLHSCDIIKNQVMNERIKQNSGTKKIKSFI